MRHSPSFTRSTPISHPFLRAAIVAALGLPAIASAAPVSFPGDTFSLHQDASGAVWREVEHTESQDVVSSPEDEQVSSARSSECTIPASAISPDDNIQNFAVPHGRFSKVPRYLVPMYEQACEDFDIPVRYLAADGSYETHFRADAMGDYGTSCGIHMFRDTKRRWTNWGFKNLADCHNPESNIRKAAEHWRNLVNRGRTLSAAIKKHNGAGPRAEQYMRTVMGGADRYYQ